MVPARWFCVSDCNVACSGLRMELKPWNIDVVVVEPGEVGVVLFACTGAHSTGIQEDLSRSSQRLPLRQRPPTWRMEMRTAVRRQWRFVPWSFAFATWPHGLVVLQQICESSRTQVQASQATQIYTSH